MNEENKNPQNTDELNEQELWDLLKQPVETEEPKERSRAKKAPKVREEPKKAPEAPAEIPEQPKADPDPKAPVVTERRKKALVFYLAGLFGIAFLIVLGSLMMRGSNGGSAEDAKRLQELETRVQTLTQERDALSDEIQALTDANDTLSMQMAAMERTMLEMAGTAEYIEGQATMSDTEAQLLSKKMEAYSLLVKAQNALIDFDREVLYETMDALADKYTYLDDSAMNAYYTIMEQMEQPYLGQ